MRILPPLLLLLAFLLASCSGAGAEPPAAQYSVVFASDRSGGGDLYAWSAGEPGPIRLTAHPSDEYRPRWVPALEKVVFVSDADDPPSLRIQDGSDLGELLMAENPGGEDPPTWSPDGRFLCYSKVTLGNEDLWIAQADGSEPRRLTDSAGTDSQPVWSPDGAWIAYRSRVVMENGDANDEIFVTSPTGGKKVNVTNTPGANEGHPAWLPDSAHLLCEADDTEDGQPDIYLVKLEHGQRENLTRHPGPDIMARMRPDGGRILFSSLRSGSWEIWTMAPDGSDVTRLTDGPGFDGEGAWVPTRALP